MAAALPIFGSVFSSVASSLLAPSPPSPPALQAPPPPPALPTEPTAEPKGALDQEAARARALRRRKGLEQESLISSAGEGKSTSKKTLLGE